MTVVIALKYKDINYIAADCRTAAWYDLINDNTDKILKHNWCLIWLAWGVAEERLFSKVLRENRDIKIDNPDIITDLYLRMRMFMKEYWLWNIGEAPAIEWLFVTDKKIWQLRPDGSILEHKVSWSIWCWWDYAKWLLDKKDIKNPTKDLKDIIKAVSKYSIWVSSNAIVKIALPPKIINTIKKTIKKQKKKTSH